MTHHTDAERAEFEAAYIAEKLRIIGSEGSKDGEKAIRAIMLHRNANGDYDNSLEAHAWWAWQQAARRAQVVPQGYRLQPLSEYDAMCAFIAAAPQPPGAAWVRPVSELLGHISDVLPDNAFDKIDTAKWNAVSALVGATQAAQQAMPAQGLDALTPAARDVLAERQRQIETEGWKTERDDVYDTGEIALAAACYAAHSASCAAIKAPHTAPGVFVRTRSAQDFVGEMWPWSEDWWKPSGHRRNLEKAGALILAEIERIDRATLAVQAKQGEQQ